jgi:hypothetical protein
MSAQEICERCKEALKEIVWLDLNCETLEFSKEPWTNESKEARYEPAKIKKCFRAAP